MILKFGAKNFYSFKEGFEVDLTLNEKISEGKGFSNVLTIKGANASGKTNVLKLLSFISSFAKDSFSEIKPNEEIFISSYFDNNEPIEMFIIFLESGIEYKYELSLTQENVIYERFHKKEKRWSKIIWRDKNKIDAISDFEEIKSIKMRPNVSFLSTALQYDLQSIEPLNNLFELIMTNVYAFGRHDGPNHQSASKFYDENKQIFEFVKDILKKSDTGIDDVRIYKQEDKETGEVSYFPVFDFIINNEKKTLFFHDQSSGTKSLYLQLGLYKIALDLGKPLILDEFDINLHPDLLPMLVDFFENDEINTKNAQLIFTTHHTDIINKLGKYKVVLVNKEENESFLYRLDEIPGDLIRNDRSISPVYNAGKIGGKPKIAI